MHMNLDKTGLESRIFDGLSVTSRRKYIYASNMQTGVSRWSKHAIEDFGMPSEYFVMVLIFGETNSIRMIENGTSRISVKFFRVKRIHIILIIECWTKKAIMLCAPAAV